MHSTHIHLFVVENYRRTSKNVESTENETSAAENEIRIKHNKIPAYVDAGMKLLQEQKKDHIILIGKGQFVNKTVTIVEMIKRKMQGTLHQYTQIGSVSVVEQWDATEEKDLDSVQISKKVPVIIAYLSFNEIPSLGRYFWTSSTNWT